MPRKTKKKTTKKKTTKKKTAKKKTAKRKTAKKKTTKKKTTKKDKREPGSPTMARQGTPKVKKRWRELVAFALALPDAYEDHPWGETVAKVRKKVFVFFGVGSCALSVKLPQSADLALGLPFCEPTGYGLGNSGWVTVYLPPDAPLEMFRDWIEESYRAVAPKKLAAQLPGS